jgi:hypothetical protein
MILALMIVGVALLGLSAWAWRRNRLLIVAGMPPFWRTFWRLRWIVGLALGCGSYFIRYPLEGEDGIYTVYGVPFMSYAFDQRGLDYVGPLTMPAIVLNFIIWACLPQLLLWLLARRPRNNTGGAGA